MRARLAISFAVLLSASNARAVALEGGTIAIAPAAGTAPVRWPAIAYDGGYLAVSGAGKITGQLLDDDGALVGASFAVNAGSNLAQAPRVCAANGKFFVTWHETIGSATRIRGRFVAKSGPLGGDLDVSPLGTNWEMGAASANLGHELLVAWQNGANAIVAQRLTDDGALLGGPIAVDATGRYQRDPAIVATASAFLVVYAGCASDKNCFVEAQRVRDGALVGDRIVLDAAVDATYVPEAAYDTTSDRVLVVWYRVASGAKSFVARIVQSDGTVSAMLPITTSGAYDANGLAFDARSRTFLFVTHGDAAQDLAIELSATGAPLSTLSFGPTGTGNFNPRVAANATRPEWIAITSTEFKTLSAQRFVTAAVETPDAGTTDAAVGETGGIDAGRPADTAATSSETDGPVDGSCGCTLRARSSPSAIASLIGLVLLGLRRRSSRGCSRHSRSLASVTAARSSTPSAQ